MSAHAAMAAPARDSVVKLARAMIMPAAGAAAAATPIGVPPLGRLMISILRTSQLAWLPAGSHDRTSSNSTA
jgi:hypothetical protein